jgi:hypothetical protein
MKASSVLVAIVCGLALVCYGDRDSSDQSNTDQSSADESSATVQEEDPDTRMYNQCMALFNNGNPTDTDAYLNCRNEYNAQNGRRSLP